MDENAKDAYDQVDKSLTASKQAIDKATGVKDKITQTISNIKNDKGMEEDIDTLNKQNGELQECIKTLESAMKSLKGQQNQTKTNVNNKNLIDIFKWDSLNLLRSAIKDNDSATGKLNSTVNESEEVQAEVKEYIKGANARPFDSKMETFTIRTEKDFGKVKYFKDKIKNVVVGEGITTIKEKAFYFCESLASINLGNVKIIGAQAFEGCTALKSIDLKNVTTIRVQAFCGTALESIDFKNVTTIEKSAFADTALKSVNLGKFQAIEDEAFSFCKALTSVELGNVKTIGVQAFYGCTALESIDFKNVTTINKQAFFGCTSLKSVNFGKVKTIKESAFESCESLGKSGVIDFKNVTTIGESAFFKCTALKSINLGSIQNIEEWTFQGCTGITTVTLPTDEKVATEIKRIICMDTDKTAGDGNNNTIEFVNDPEPAAATQET